MGWLEDLIGTVPNLSVGSTELFGPGAGPDIMTPSNFSLQDTGASYGSPSLSPSSFDLSQVGTGGGPAPGVAQQIMQMLSGAGGLPWGRIASFALPAAGLLYGQYAGQTAGRDIENRYSRQASSIREPTDMASILASIGPTLSPGIQEAIYNERRAMNQPTEQAISMGVPHSSALAQIKADMAARTNRGIAAAIAQAVQQESASRRGANVGAAQLGGQGVAQGMQAAGQAAGGPMSALILASLLGGKGGLFG